MSAPIRNIMFFFGDQHRSDCLGCYGNEIVRTPTLDSLSETGTRFTRALSTSPVCTPARASVQTGLHAHDHGLQFNPEFARQLGGKMNVDCGTEFFAQRLRKHGWNLAHIGKWHIGDFRTELNRTLPANVGYDNDVYFPGYGYPMSAWLQHPDYLQYLKSLGVEDYELREPVNSPDGTRTYAAIAPGPKEASVPYYLATRTAEKIRSYAGSTAPFFISCNFWGPHQPVYLPEEAYRAYEGMDIPVWPNFNADLSARPTICRRWGEFWQMHRVSEELMSRLIGYHYAYITHIDECIGVVIDALKATGQLDETLVAYSADHGDSLGSMRMFDKGFGLYEFLVNIPMILWHHSFAAQVNDGSVSLLDLPATFLDVAGLEPSEKMPGRSLLPVARGEVEEIHEEIQVTMHYGHTQPARQIMARDRRWKLIFNLNAEHEFYDLRRDPHEMHNLYGPAFQPEIDRLRSAIREWNAACRNDYTIKWVELL